MSDSLGLGAVELPAPIQWREIKDVETLRVVADPTRIAILRVLMTDAELRPPIMSAKELAATLEEPQTKLYRHLKQLEEHGLIQVAETRLVSGIVEQRYRTAQLSIGMSPELVIDPETRTESFDLATAAFNDFRDEMAAHARSGRLRLESTDDVTKRMIMETSFTRVSRDRAGEFHTRLVELIREFRVSGEPGGVPVHLFVTMYSEEEPES